MHIPVLIDEVLEYLDPQQGDVVVDATFGFGGHSKEILKKIGDKGTLIGIEKDKEVFDKVSDQFEQNVKVVNSDFENIDQILDKLKIKSVDKILFDLGISSFHFDESDRGFSFARNEPLDMRLDKESGVTAADLLNGLSRDELANLIFTLSDEPKSRVIAKEVYEQRKKSKIETTDQLVEIIKKVKPYSGKINPATQTFQALRIAVNDELHKLEDTLPKALKILKKGGRIAVISFHSGEDRIVKNVFREMGKDNIVKILTKKPIVASFDEIKQNPRSRSAKLRAIERI